MWNRWNFQSLFLKIVHQKGIFDAIKENPNFPILHIYCQWLLNTVDFIAIYVVFMHKTLH